MIIMPMQRDFNKFLGEQKIESGELVPSRYNYLFTADDGAVLAYNTFSGAVAVLSNEQHRLLCSKNVAVDSKATPELEELIKYRFLVHPSVNEVEAYCELYSAVKDFTYNPPITSYTVLTTTGCNARCFYCFEQGFKPSSMKRETAEALADYMITNSKGHKINIHWFGGEPLCNTAAMNTISARLSEKGAQFISTMTSNGYAFSDENIDTAVSLWNLKSVQVTLDGLHDEHNRRKNFITESPDPFHQTIENIHKLIHAGIAVSIRLNFDSENVADIPKLIDFLAEEFKGCKGVAAYPAALFEDCNTWNPARDNDENQKLIQVQSELSEYIRQKFVLSEKSVCRGFSTAHCGANSPMHRTINPNGTFAFCHNFSDSSVFGSIFEGITDSETYKKWTDNDRLREKCSECIWLPECTAFDMCPVKKSFCQINYENLVRSKLLRIYKKRK